LEIDKVARLENKSTCNGEVSMNGVEISQFENLALLLTIQVEGNASKLDHSTQIDTSKSPVHHNLTLHHILILIVHHFGHAQKL